MNGTVKSSVVWKLKTSRSGWKMNDRMVEGELEEWNAWMKVERKSLLVMIRDFLGFEDSADSVGFDSIGPLLPNTWPLLPNTL